MPSKEYSNIIKKSLSSPNYMIKLLNDNAEKLGETAYKKAIQAAEKIAGLFCVSDKMLLTISYILTKYLFKDFKYNPIEDNSKLYEMYVR